MNKKSEALKINLVVSAFFLAWMGPAAAEGEVVVLPPIVVTPARSPEPLTEVPASVSFISHEEITNSPARELDAVLPLVPGIDLLGYSGEEQHPTSDSIGMRGLGGAQQGISRALVMVDGVPINDAFFGYIQWGRVPLQNVDHVEIVRGGGSPLWGNYAEGGVINVITREPSTQEAILDAGGGSYGTYRASGYGSYLPSAKNKIQGFASFEGTDGFQQVPEYERVPFNVPTSYRTENVQIKDSIAPGGDLSGHLTLNYHHDDQRLETLLDTNSQEIYSLVGDVTRQFSGEAALTATAFYSNSGFNTHNSTYFPDAADLAATTQSLNEVHDVSAYDTGGSLIWSQKFTGWLTKYMVGADLHYINGRDHTTHYVAPDFSPEYVATVSRGDQTFVGGFVQAFASPTDKLKLTGSGRVQYLQNTNGDDGSVGGVGAVPDQDHTRFDPRIDARYALAHEFALRGAYYQSFRAPSLADQYYTFAAGGFALLPNSNLKPEDLSGGEIGVDYTRGGLFSQFTVYRTDIDNYIVEEPTSNPAYPPANWFLVQNVNVAKVRAQGFEAEINWDVGAGVSTTLSYTYADSIVESNPLDPASEGKQLVDVPKNKAAVGITYKHSQDWRVSTQAYWVDRTNWASADHIDPGYPGKISADEHLVVDLSGSYNITTKVEAYLNLHNIFDRRYIVTSFSAPSAQVLGAPFEAFAGVRVML